jgi:hypothetical protein
LSKTLTANVITAKNAASTYVAFLAEFEFASGDVYFTNSPTTVTWSGKTYVGLGNLSNVEPIKESVDLQAIGLKFILSGANSTIANIALTEHVQGKLAFLYVAFMNDGLIIGDPVLEFAGRVDNMVVTESEGSTSIQLAVESRMADWARPNVRRFNSTDHKEDYPNDKFFDFVENMVEKEIVWPSKLFFKYEK